MDNHINRQQIDCFLKQMIQENNDDRISDKMKIEISNMYLKYTMEKKGIKFQENEEELLMKYLTLGWFIYNTIEEQKPIENHKN
jgi:hypothetical protein